MVEAPIRIMPRDGEAAPGKRGWTRRSVAVVAAIRNPGGEEGVRGAVAYRSSDGIGARYVRSNRNETEDDA